MDIGTPAERGNSHAGHYVEVLDERKLVVASPGRALPNTRWRVRDNLPGSPAFCPMVRKTRECDQAVAVNLPALLTDLALEFGEDLLMRSAVWLTLRESKSSFAIEGEDDQADRIQRFAEILGRLTTLQRFGLRQSPVFVEEVVRYQEVIHYVAPPAKDVQAMLDGLAIFWERTKGQAAVLRSAVMRLRRGQ